MRQDAVCWTVRGGRVLGPAPFLILGVLNATPDSFFDGGNYASLEAAVAQGRALALAGADILDIGGESTRPNAVAVSAEEEMARVLPLVKTLAALDAEFPAAPVISIDTTKAVVAAMALEAGAAIVNDVSACRVDPDMRDALVQYKPGYVLMHSQGRPADMQRNPVYTDVVEEILSFFHTQLSALVRAGLPEDRVVLDPGVGFGKRLEHNLEILRRVGRFLELGRPVLLGLSNKSLWGQLLGLAAQERGNATQAATAIAAMKGVRLHRVHDVAATRQTLRVVVAMSRAHPNE